MFKLLIAASMGIVVVLVLTFWRMLGVTYNLKLWPAIRRARVAIRAVARQRIPSANVLSRQGATSINPRYLAFCITTSTDRERDLLRDDSEIYQEFRKALLAARYPEEAVGLVHFGIQSQETVDRDYGGHWSEALEMP